MRSKLSTSVYVLVALVLIYLLIGVLVPLAKQYQPDVGINRNVEQGTGAKPVGNVSDCMASLAHCVRQIERFSTQAPRLLSYQQDVPAHHEHRRNHKPFLVPNIVHMISFGTQQPFRFFNYVAYKSIHKFIRPQAIFLWADETPSSNATWWTQTLQEVANIYFVFARPRRKIGGRRVRFVAHATDYLRLEIMNEIGGMYFDNDVIVLKSFDDMRVYPLALGRATERHLSNGIMAAERGSKFINIWLDTYRSYDPKSFTANSVIMASELSEMYPHLIHVEATSFNHPTWQDLNALYQDNYDLTDNYSLHLYWWKLYYLPESVAELDGYNCTVGSAMRIVLYDSPNLRRASNITVGRTLGKEQGRHEMFK